MAPVRCFITVATIVALAAAQPQVAVEPGHRHHDEPAQPNVPVEPEHRRQNEPALPPVPIDPKQDEQALPPVSVDPKQDEQAAPPEPVEPENPPGNEEAAAKSSGESDDSATLEENSISIVDTILIALNDRLQSSKCQWGNALFALVFGLVMVLDGEFCFRNIVVVSIGIFTYLLAEFEIKHTWPLVDDEIMRVLSLEVAIAISVVAYHGYPGIKLFVGMLFGLVGAFYLYQHVGALQHSGWFILILGNTCVLLGLWSFTGKAHKRLTALISCLAGGAMVSSAVGFFIMWICVKTGLLVQKLDIPQTMPSWVEFLEALISPHAKKFIGIFSHSGANPTIQGHKFSLDHAIGIFLWIVLSIFGMFYQRYCEQKLAALRGSNEKAGDKAGNNLGQSLLSA